MFKLNKKATNAFSTDTGSAIYSRVLDTIEKHGMKGLIDGGVLLGFSGGADSVMLLLFLLEYRRREEKTFNITCVHLNHGIRGEEAKRDEIFSSNMVSDSSAEFIAISKDIPVLAKALGTGLEETARNARYSVFEDIIQSRNDISCIAIAHNSTDNLETVIFNMLRGAGLSGVCGIKPVRDNIVRPLISVSKREILEFLQTNDIPYVTDSTNLSSEYSRNYIRNQILPLFERISDNPEAAVARMSENLRADLAYIETEADKFLTDIESDSYISARALAQLPSSLFAKVISKLIYKKCGIYPEEKHITALKALMARDNFSFSLPGKYVFSCQRGKCSFMDKSAENPLNSMIFPLSLGENIIDGTNLVVYIGEVDKSSLNVYNFSIQATVSSAIIDDGIQLRVKKDGDAYKYSGITHKLKKVFNDRNIPPFEREYIPVIVDSKGVLWVPGLPVRDGALNSKESSSKITVCFKEAAAEDTQMFTALKRV